MSWIFASDVSSSLFSQKSPNFHCVGGFEVYHWRQFTMEILQVVSHGDLGSLPWRLKHCINPIWWSWNDWIGLRLRQFTAGGVFSTVLCPKMLGVLKGVHSDVKRKGLERSQFVTFCCIRCCAGSWKESISDEKHKGLERSQFLTFCQCSHCKGLERSQFQCKTQGSWKESLLMHRGLERSQFGLKYHVCHSSCFTVSSQSSRWSSALSVEGLDDFRLADLFFLSAARGDVSWSWAAGPVSGAVDGVMKCNMKNVRLV